MRNKHQQAATAAVTVIDHHLQQQQQKQKQHMSLQIKFTSIYTVKRGEGERKGAEIANDITSYLLCLLPMGEVKWLREVRECMWGRERESSVQTLMPAHPPRGGNITVNLMNSCYLIPTGIHTLSVSPSLALPKQSLGTLPSVRTLLISATPHWWIFYFCPQPVIMTLWRWGLRLEY